MKGKLVILGLVLALALAASACKKSSDDNNTAAAAVVGNKFLLSMGGDSAGGDGGDGYGVYIYSQAQNSILNWGSFTIPNVVMPAGALMITTDTIWDDAMQTDLENGLFDGLYVAPGVTLTVPDDVYLWYCGYPGCYVYGVYGFTYGPVVIMGNVVSDGDNVDPVIFEVFAAQDTAADDNAIVVTGLIDMSGPDMADDDGVDGGVIYLGNDDYQDTEFGIYISGDIVSNGGDATDALASYDGGYGGSIYVVGGDNENILVSGNIVSNGGDAAGDGDGGGANWIEFVNSYDTYGVPTNDSTGQIAFFDLNQINMDGGTGYFYGGDSHYDLYFTSDRSSVYINVPMFAVGGSATTTVADEGYGGNGLYHGINVYSNEDFVDVDELIGTADVIILSRLQANGGDGTYGGGLGGYSYIYAYCGNLYISDIIDFRGGNATANAVDSYGGDSGSAYFTVYNYDESSTEGEAYFTAVRDVIMDGGNGGEYGGDVDDYYSYNYSTGAIILAPAYVAMRPGVGSVENGDYGYSYIYGPAIAFPYFPSLAEFLSW